MRKILYSLLVGSLLAGPVFSDVKPQAVAVQEIVMSQQLEKLSEWIAELQAGLENEGIEKIWIGGGSARAILDHIYFNKPLKMRDLDVFAIANQEVTEELARRIGEHLSSQSLGKLSENDVRNRPSATPNMPVLQRNDYVAGWGLHWLRNQDEILDLSIYHEEKDLNLNGIFDVDTVMIPLSKEQTLLDWFEEVKKAPYSELHQRQLTYDRFNGYVRWVNHELKVVNWVDIESDPLLKVFRVIRPYAREGIYQLPKEEEASLQYLIQNGEVKNPLQLTRGLLRILDEDNYKEQLKMLRDLGLFKKWLPEFDEPIELKMEESAPQINYGRGSVQANSRLYALLQTLDSRERVSASYTSMAAYSLETALIWMYEGFFDRAPEGKVLEAIKSYEDKEGLKLRMGKIATSRTLSMEEKKALFLRTLFPSEQDRKRVGAITGVFNPLNLGQLEMMKIAINEMVLDELIVVPTMEVGPFEEPINWEERYRMTALGIKEIKEAKMVSSHYRESISQGVESSVERLERDLSGAQFIRVMGSDSLPAFQQSQGKQFNGSENKLLAIIDRKGSEQKTPEALGPFIYRVKEESGRSSHQKPHLGKEVRALLRGGKSANHLLPRGVAEYVNRHHPYGEKEPALNLFTTNTLKKQQALAIFPKLEQINHHLPTIEGNPDEIIQDKLMKAVALRDSNAMVIETFIEVEGVTRGPVTIPVFNRIHSAAPADEKSPRAQITSVIGYAKDPKNFQIYQSSVLGRLDASYMREFDSLQLEHAFIADGEEKPYSELSEERLRVIHPTYIALQQLKLQQPLKELFPGKELPDLTLTAFSPAEKVKLKRILKSKTLKSEDKQKLLLKLYLRHLLEKERHALLKAVDMPEEVLATLEQKEIGLMTGVFNPMHLGHIEAIQHAVEEMALDQLILIPTPATSHNEKPIEWEKRLEMAKLAVGGLSEVKVISSDYETTFQEGTGKVLERLLQEKPNANWVHVMGSDSFKRFHQSQQASLGSQYQVLVIQRSGEAVAPITKPYVYYFQSSENSQLGQEERASSVIRKYRQEGDSISHLVQGPVADYIEKENLYR